MVIEVLDIFMRNGQRLNPEQLRQEAEDAVHKSKKKRFEVATELDVSPGSISSALNNAGTRWASIQMRIIEKYTGYTIEPDPGFLVHKKEISKGEGD